MKEHLLARESTRHLSQLLSKPKRSCCERLILLPLKFSAKAFGHRFSFPIVFDFECWQPIPAVCQPDTQLCAWAGLGRKSSSDGQLKVRCDKVRNLNQGGQVEALLRAVISLSGLNLPQYDKRCKTCLSLPLIQMIWRTFLTWSW